MNTKKKIWTTQTLITTAMLAAIAGVLMSLEISIPFIPSFYKVDFSDVPSLIALFLMGPIPAVCVEVIKILIKLVTIGTSSMFVGDLSNLLSIVMYILPLWLFYSRLGKTKKAAVAALLLSIPCRIAYAAVANVFILLPMYAAAMEMPIDGIIEFAATINPAITDMTTFVLLATIPFNLLKISLNYITGFLIYENLRKISFVRQSLGA